VILIVAIHCTLDLRSLGRPLRSGIPLF
jgi:hypothetical protein